MKDASQSAKNERINELIEFIRKNKFRTLEYDNKLVRNIIKNVTVYENHFTISFKSGIETEILKTDGNSQYIGEMLKTILGYLLGHALYDNLGMFKSKLLVSVCIEKVYMLE